MELKTGLRRRSERQGGIRGYGSLSSGIMLIEITIARVGGVQEARNKHSRLRAARGQFRTMPIETDVVTPPTGQQTDQLQVPQMPYVVPPEPKIPQSPIAIPRRTSSVQFRSQADPSASLGLHSSTPRRLTFQKT
jgi:hypothetical protein